MAYLGRSPSRHRTEIEDMGLNLTPGETIIDYLDDVNTIERHHHLARRGVTPKAAQARIRANFTCGLWRYVLAWATPWCVVALAAIPNT